MGSIFELLVPIVLIVNAITLLVLRAGASRVFFDIVGTFQAERLITDAKAAGVVFEALYLDTFSGIQEAGQDISKMFTEMVDAVMPVTEEIEEARIQLEKFLDVGEGQMEEIASLITDIGLGFGFSADQAMEAGAKMAQLSGVLGSSTMGVGTEVGMMFGLISGMETDIAMQRMINLQQQTKFMTKNLEENMTAEQRATRIRQDSITVLNQLNTVENRSVATMEQITFVMNQFASQAELTNESIASMAALSATLIEAGEEQGKGGRALRMMYARLGANINGSRDAIEKLGIAVADGSGSMRQFSDILEEVAVKYHTMTGEQQTQLAQQVAGNRHYTRLIKLLENVDRVKELEFEATIAMFPAMDEIDRRRDTELFKLQKAEAAYKNQIGILGNAFLPTLTAVTKQQTVFMKNINWIASQDNVISSIITGPLALIKSAEAFAGPAMTMLISLHNINLAMRTQAIIGRALRGDKIASMGDDKTIQGHMINEIALLKEKTRQEQIYSLVSQRNKRLELTQGRNLNESAVKYARTRVKNLNNEIVGHQTKIKKIGWGQSKIIDQEKIYQSILLTGNKKEKQAAVEALATLETRKIALTADAEKEIGLMNKVATHRDLYQAKIDQALDNSIRKQAMLTEFAVLGSKQQAAAIMEVTMALGGVGAVIMMLPDKFIPFISAQEKMRYGMALTGIAMGIQTGKTLLSAGASLIGASSTKILKVEQVKLATSLGITSDMIENLVIRQQFLDISNKQAAASTAGLSTTVVATSKASATGLRAAWMAIPAIGQIMIVVAGLILLYKGMKKAHRMAQDMGIMAKKTKKEDDEYAKGQLDSGLVIEYMKDPLLDVNALLEKKITLHKTLKDSQDQLTIATAEGLAAEITALKQVNRIRKFSNEDFDASAAENIFEDLNYYNKVMKDGKGSAFKDDLSIFSMAGLADFNERTAKSLGQGYIKSLGGPMATATEKVKNFKEEYADLAAFIDLHSITTFEELELSVESFGTSIRKLMGEEEEGVISLAKEYSMLNNELQGFSDSREEMFYGFDRNNLTGDLVRQVTQQGVETLITSTEVIMTNNFNNILTIPQMADKIIDEINSRGVEAGYSVF